MDYETYRRKYFPDPQPESRFAIEGLHGVALYYADYTAALEFFHQVFGPPNYSEGEGTRGWHLGDCWLTVFPASTGHPKNNEVHLLLQNSAELDRLRQAFLDAGAQGDPPEQALMYEPLVIAALTDPFGGTWLLLSRVDQA